MQMAGSLDIPCPGSLLCHYQHQNHKKLDGSLLLGDIRSWQLVGGCCGGREGGHIVARDTALVRLVSRQVSGMTVHTHLACMTFSSVQIGAIQQHAHVRTRTHKQMLIHVHHTHTHVCTHSMHTHTPISPTPQPPPHPTPHHTHTHPTTPTTTPHNPTNHTPYTHPSNTTP